MNDLPRTPGLALLHHRGPRRHGFARGHLAASDPARRQPAAEGAGREHRPAAFQPHAGRLYPDRSGRRLAAAGAPDGIGLGRISGRRPIRCANRCGQRCASAPSWIPSSIRLGPFVRSLATSAKKTEVFLRYGMSDDVLAQIGKGELDVGYYIDATPSESLASGTLPERTIEDGKFRLMAADALRLPRDRSVRMERQGARKGLGRPHRPALDHDAACSRRIGG